MSLYEMLYFFFEYLANGRERSIPTKTGRGRLIEEAGKKENKRTFAPKQAQSSLYLFCLLAAS
jgi:hypothetical protein